MFGVSEHTMGGVPVPSVSCGDPTKVMNQTTVGHMVIVALQRVRSSLGHEVTDVYLATNMDCSDARVGALASTLRHRSGARLVCNQKALLERVAHDNFVASLIEQELCARAAGFVGSKFSTWTDTVKGMRASRGSRELTFSFEEMWSQGLR